MMHPDIARAVVNQRQFEQHELATKRRFLGRRGRK